MLPLILAPLVSMFAEKGLDVLSKTLDIGGEKVVQLVEEKTGIKLTEPGKVTDDEMLKLKEFQTHYELELLRISLDNKREDNRHEESISGSVLGDKQNARGSNHLFEMQSEIGNRVFLQTSVIIPLLILINVLLITYASDLKLGEAMISMVSTLIGIALNNAYRERQTMLEFLYGSSVGSKIKDIK